MFLVEQEGKRKAYIDVVRAGGGTVLEDWDLDQLIKYKPGSVEGGKAIRAHRDFHPQITSQIGFATQSLPGCLRPALFYLPDNFLIFVKSFSGIFIFFITV